MPITGGNFRKAALKHAEKKGFIGAHARWAAWISEELLEDFAVWLNLCEEAGLWPEAVRQILIRLIPEAKGGTRPIRLIEWIVKFYEKREGRT